VTPIDHDDALAALQATLRPLDDGPHPPVRTIVILPSIDVEVGFLAGAVRALPAYEERSLYLLLALRRPELRVVVVTSVAVPDAVLDYILGLVPEADPAELRGRVTMLDAGDASPRPLAVKVLEQPALVERLREAIGDPRAAFIAPFTVGRPERDLAVRLGLPVYGPDSRYAEYGTKSGGRRLFADEGVEHPLGVEYLADLDGLTDALLAMRSRRPALAAVVVKLGDGVSGDGNVVVDLAGLPTAGAAGEAAAVRELLATRLGEEYLELLAADPGIVEELIGGEEVRSPSVQMRILAGGLPGLVSTHDQVLGGDNGQVYAGCRFPAAAAYAPKIVAAGEKIRRRLAREGVVGRFGVDFVVAREGAEWRPYAVEINLREGGTSHPFGSLYLLAGGACEEDGRRYRTARGEERFYVSSDDLDDPRAAGAAVGALLAGARRSGLAWDPRTETGVVFHMLQALAPLGRIGATAIGDSRDAAQELFDRTTALLGTLEGADDGK
jgi:hypothetical protein